MGIWDLVGFAYFDLLISPAGEVGHYKAWAAEGRNPEDLLLPHEFAWLWGLLEEAPVLPWTAALKARVREAYRDVATSAHGRSTTEEVQQSP